MSETFDRVRALVERGEVRVSDHGYDEISDENILARDVLAGVFDGIIVEDYPTYGKGPCVLVLQRDLDQRPVHVVWGIPKDLSSPASLLRLINLTLVCGLKISRGGSHEKEATHKICSRGTVRGRS